VRPTTRAGAVLVLAVVLIAAAVAATALAATGALTPQDCVDDNDTGAESCAQAHDGLDAAFGAAVSPDGESLYVSSGTDHAIVRFSRDTGDGTLTPLDCIDDDESGPEAGCSTADGLNNPQSIAISPDGMSVYVAAVGDDAIVRFDRDPDTGALTDRDCIDDNDVVGDDCGQSTDGLDGVGGVAVSPDGESVYAASLSDDAIVRFDRDNVDDGGDPDDLGELTPQGCMEDDDTGADDCAQSTDGLDGANAVAVSADGKSVYAAGLGDDAVTHLTRNTTTGALSATDGDCVDDNDTGDDACLRNTNGLDGVQSLALSPDGKSLYAPGSTDDAVVHLTRNTTSGALTPQGCVDDNDTGADTCDQSADGLEDAVSPQASPDGKSLYVVSFSDAAVARLKRSTSNGSLAPRGCVDDNDTGDDACAQSTDGLGGAARLALSPNGLSLYATAISDDAVVRFDREIDATPPAVAVASGPAGTTGDATPSFGFTAEAGASTQCRFDSAAFGACSGPGKTHTPAAPLDEGGHTFQVRATDDSENSATASRSFKVANPPETAIDQAPKDKLKAKKKTAKATYEFSSDESGSSFECSLDGEAFAPCTSPLTEKVKKGKHTFEVRARDATGNVDQTPAEDSFKVKKKRRK